MGDTLLHADIPTREGDRVSSVKKKKEEKKEKKKKKRKKEWERICHLIIVSLELLLLLGLELSNLPLGLILGLLQTLGLL